MRVTVDEFVGESSLVVYLDTGEEVGRYCVVDDPEREREDLERMIIRCVGEAMAPRPKPQASAPGLEGEHE